MLSKRCHKSLSVMIYSHTGGETLLFEVPTLPFLTNPKKFMSKVCAFSSTLDRSIVDP